MTVRQLMAGTALVATMASAGCSSMNKTQKGAAVGVGAGAAAGAIIGKMTGNTGMGAIIGAAAGGVAGTLIGKKMDKQAEELKKQVPDAKVERVGEGIVVEFSSNVLFGLNKSEVSLDASSTLDKLIKVLNNYPDTDLEVQGHTDSTGTAAYNQSLSLKRATSAASYLKNHGIASSRITTKGFGKDLPKYPNSTESGRAGNRRVEFLISANEKMRADAEKEAGN